MKQAYNEDSLNAPAFLSQDTISVEEKQISKFSFPLEQGFPTRGACTPSGTFAYLNEYIKGGNKREKYIYIWVISKYLGIYLWILL